MFFSVLISNQDGSRIHVHPTYTSDAYRLIRYGDIETQNQLKDTFKQLTFREHFTGSVAMLMNAINFRGADVIAEYNEILAKYKPLLNITSLPAEALEDFIKKSVELIGAPFEKSAVEEKFNLSCFITLLQAHPQYLDFYISNKPILDEIFVICNKINPSSYDTYTLVTLLQQLKVPLIQSIHINSHSSANTQRLEKIDFPESLIPIEYFEQPYSISSIYTKDKAYEKNTLYLGIDKESAQLTYEVCSSADIRKLVIDNEVVPLRVTINQGSILLADLDLDPQLADEYRNKLESGKTKFLIQSLSKILKITEEKGHTSHGDVLADSNPVGERWTPRVFKITPKIEINEIELFIKKAEWIRKTFPENYKSKYHEFKTQITNCDLSEAEFKKIIKKESKDFSGMKKGFLNLKF